MTRSNWTPRTVPYGADQTVYLVVDRFREASVYRETELERTDLETLNADFMTGQFNDPVRVIAFIRLNTGQTTCLAAEIQTRCDMEGAVVPEHVRDFVRSYTDPALGKGCPSC